MGLGKLKFILSKAGSKLMKMYFYFSPCEFIYQKAHMGHKQFCLYV